MIEQEVKLILRNGTEVHRMTTFTAEVQERRCARCGKVERRKLDP